MSAADVKLNMLVAYPYLKKQMLDVLRDAQDEVRLVVDSGAFTAWKAGKPIDLDDYCRFIETLPIRPWRYFTLDVVGDPHATLRNYQTMRDRGFNPVPIFTRGEDVSVLEDYYRTSDLVGVGGLVKTQGNTGFVNGIMKAIAGRRVHLLGFTRIEFLKAYRPYMCDASSWEAGAIYGDLQIYVGGARFLGVTKKDFVNRPAAHIVAAIRRLGYAPEELRREAAWHGGNSLNRRLCATSGVAFSLDAQKNLGTLVFLANTSNVSAKLLIDGFRKLREMSA